MRKDRERSRETNAKDRERDRYRNTQQQSEAVRPRITGKLTDR